MAGFGLWLRTMGKWLGHAVCPTRCACCSKVIYPHEDLCPQCREQLPWIGEDICPSCGKNKSQCICQRKRTEVACISPFFYQGVVKQGILTLKRATTAHGAAYFGKQMADLAANRFGSNFDGIVYVPMLRKKERQRGYNQSRLLAKSMGKALHLPVLDNALIKLYDTPEQHTSPYNRRKGNVFGAYQANEELVADKHLLLVDDIVTTGATLDECAKMLFLAGCEEVRCVTAASTQLEHQPAEEQPL